VDIRNRQYMTRYEKILDTICNIFKTSKLYEMMSFPEIVKQKLKQTEEVD